jgi:hypothetical protein
MAGLRGWNPACMLPWGVASNPARSTIGDLERLEINSIGLAIDTGIALAGAAKALHQAGHGRAAANALQGALSICTKAEIRLRGLRINPLDAGYLRARLLGLRQQAQQFQNGQDALGPMGGR